MCYLKRAGNNVTEEDASWFVVLQNARFPKDIVAIVIIYFRHRHYNYHGQVIFYVLYTCNTVKQNFIL